MPPVTPSVRWLAEAPRRPRDVALGTFDGVHLGHRRVIAQAGTVLTFSPHPRAVIGEAPPLLQDFERKLELFGELGVEEVVLIPFDRETAAMSPAAFVNEILVESLVVARVSVGENFHFGSRGAGTVADLVADRRFQTRVEPLLTVEGEAISSSRIRNLVEAGLMDRAARLLGDPFEVRCGLGPAAGGRRRLLWPEGVVQPHAGCYRVALRPALGEPVPAEVRFGVDGAWLLEQAPLPAVWEPLSVRF